jgi:uncharacterized protein YbjT (DUF2867 family)
VAATAEGRRLVAGATGYIGGELVREMLTRGDAVRALARDRSRAAGLESRGADVVEADVLRPETLPRALEGVEVAYYLVHSMGRGGSGDFSARDREAAHNFGSAAAEAGVGEIVYLGGLGEPGSKHLRSRHETAEVLGGFGVPVTYFRAAAVIGSGSESFRTVVYLVKRLPVMITPSWTRTKTQPVAIGDVVAYLAAAPEVDGARGREIELGGPEVTTYGGMMDAAARALGVRPRRRINVPLLTPQLSSLWIGLVTPVDTGVARPLVEGLETETVVSDPSGMELFDVRPTPLDTAMRAAVEELEGSGSP